MSNLSGAKGDRGEREAKALVADLLGHKIERTRAGWFDDRGDLHGLPDTTIQVANWADVARAAREKPLGAEAQRLADGATFAATLVRFRGGIWRVVLTPEQWATYWREAQPDPVVYDRGPRPAWPS